MAQKNIPVEENCVYGQMSHVADWNVMAVAWPAGWLAQKHLISCPVYSNPAITRNEMPADDTLERNASSSWNMAEMQYFPHCWSIPVTRLYRLSLFIQHEKCLLQINAVKSASVGGEGGGLAQLSMAGVMWK